MSPSQPFNVQDFEALARAKMEPGAFGYYFGGAEDEITLRRNREAFADLGLLPRVLVDVSAVDTAVEIYGKRSAMPILVAPTAFHRLAHSDGERATARAAAKVGTIYTVSTIATTRLEEVAAAAPGAERWFQLYVYKDRAVTDELVARAEELVRASPMGWTVLRPAEVYGAGSEGLNGLIERVREGHWVPVIGDGRARLAPVFIEDVVLGFAAAIEREPRGETLILAGPEELTYRELVTRLGRHFGRRPRILPVPLPLARLAALLLATLLRRPPLTRDQIPRLLSPKPYDIEEARVVLGFSPRSLEEGLAAPAG